MLNAPYEQLLYATDVFYQNEQWKVTSFDTKSVQIYLVNYLGSGCSKRFIYDRACCTTVHWVCDDPHEDH